MQSFLLFCFLDKAFGMVGHMIVLGTGTQALRDSSKVLSGQRFRYAEARCAPCVCLILYVTNV